MSSFISNSTVLGGDKGRIHVLSGPNSSGKSVYMKQVGLIVFLGQLGCWVPAAAARIPIFYQLFTRIQTVESVSLGLSSFLCDINQVRFGGKLSKFNLLHIFSWIMGWGCSSRNFCFHLHRKIQNTFVIFVGKR